MSKTLVELVDEVNAIERMLVESNGELTAEIEALLSEVDVSLPQKVDGYAYRLDRLNMVSAFYLDRSKQLLRLSEQTKKATEVIRSALKLAMDKMGKDSVSGNDVTFRLQNATPSVVIDDESKIPGEYIISETVTKIDKRQIAAQIKSGVLVNGAHLEQSRVLRTYMDGAKYLKK